MKRIANGEAAAQGMLSSEELQKLDAYWRAANYLSVGQIYLLDNPLLKERLRIEHVKPRLLGHWGTTPGLSFIYAHLNRVIKRDGLDYNLAYISVDFQVPRSSPFDQAYMQALFDYGYHQATGGRLWHKAPPGLHTTRPEREAASARASYRATEKRIVLDIDR